MLETTKSLSSWRAWIEIGNPHGNHSSRKSLSSWRAWIEIISKRADYAPWARSLSSWRAWIEIQRWTARFSLTAMSLSSWRAWIEMTCTKSPRDTFLGRSPHGERGLKLDGRRLYSVCDCRSPHGERGLKYVGQLHGLLIGQGRSPHGERGLKYRRFDSASYRLVVALLMESVD